MYNYRFNVYPVETTEGVEWIVRFPEVNNCGGSGKTVELAIQDAYENLEFELAMMEEEGKPLPISNSKNNYSGKLLVRMPKSLHERLTKIAEEEEVSINQLVVSTLSERVGLYNSLETVGAYGVTKGMEKVLKKVIGNSYKQLTLSDKFNALNEQQEELFKAQSIRTIQLVGGIENLKRMYSQGYVRR